MSAMIEILAALVQRLDGAYLKRLNVIPWAAPVISFGNISKSRIATLGLNPSNREFVDATGKELVGRERRFHTLKSLGIKRWSCATEEHFDAILASCNNYFEGNSYDTWFRSLDKLLTGIDATYYGMFSDACHLDLVPYATSCKWAELSTNQRKALYKGTGDTLGLILRSSSVEVLVLNGRSVIECLQVIGNVKLTERAIPSWTLPRKGKKGVVGYAYTGTLNEVLGVSLGREISVLGYSHNIQSSFGVTKQVKDAIQHWITCNTNEVLC